MVDEEDKIIVRGRCDICDKKDVLKGDTLLKCKVCGVCVHKNCYGETTEKKNPEWVCKACEAVGKEFAGRKYGSDKTYKIVQNERPMECVLCSIRTGNHAMHMVYDKEAPEGCPLVLSGSSAASKTKDNFNRLAWVHSLCAFSVCTNPSTRGCIYGEGIGGEDDDDFIPMNHLVFSDIDPWQRIIDEHRGNLVCDVCGQKDNRKNILRIPLQCHAGDGNEFLEFQGCHPNLREGECCYSSMHVGCARWGKHKNGSDFANPRVYFYPGKEGDEDSEHCDPVLAIYCHLHAKDIKNRCKKQKSSEKTSEKRNKIKFENYGESSHVKKLGSSKTKEKEEDEEWGDEEEDYTSSRKSNFSGTGNKKKEYTTQLLAATAGKSVYLERKRLMDNTFHEALTETKKCIKRAQQNNSSVEDALKRLKSHLTNHSGLTKKEFRLVWERIEAKIDKSWNKRLSSTGRKSIPQKRKIENLSMKEQVPNVSGEDTEPSREIREKQIFNDLRKAKKKSKKPGYSYEVLLSQIKKYWKNKIQTTAEDFEDIWKGALDKLEGFSDPNIIQNSTIQAETKEAQIAVVESPADNWSFLHFGPHYSIAKAYEYFENWD